jgi:hypothetical protein
MGASEVQAFLTHLAVEGNVAASTQNQALSALLFLYREVLHQDLGTIDALRARWTASTSRKRTKPSCEKHTVTLTCSTFDGESTSCKTSCWRPYLKGRRAPCALVSVTSLVTFFHEATMLFQ